jgi:2-oxoglutarate dehydrogenase E1 component
MGRVRAKQDRMGDKERKWGLPLLIHGDAAFAGQGIVAEGLNMSGLEAYTTGGSIHVVVNNQIGFTTSPKHSYCTTYPTDVARMLQVPILHVHGEDPEAIACAVDLAVDFRQRFARDVVIDLWCYRKHGHNEADEPAYTQPVMYRAIAAKTGVGKAYLGAFAKSAQGDDRVGEEDAVRLAAAHRRKLEEALESAKQLPAPPKPSTLAGVWSKVHSGPDSATYEVATAVRPDIIERVGAALTTVPENFAPHPKAARLLEDRRAMVAGSRPLDWGMGEAMAFGTLVHEGVRVRMSGQDVRRGTFSHRHATLFDHRNGTEFTPLEHVAEHQGTFEIRDSCLSEAGVLGFEYGYSLDRPEDLVIWEAQFGDFVNSAQVIIDQFLVSSEAKWRRVSGLVMFLPHGMEGQGPEHSNARPERWLNMGINDNIQVCNLTTPAQLFHLLRRQVLRPYRKPLIVMSPKSLLRHKLAVSSLTELTGGAFQHVIPDTTTAAPEVERVILCSGKVYYDLFAARQAMNLTKVALVRIEQLYPLRRDQVLSALATYRPGTRVLWVQEEARNMGAWYYMSREVQPILEKKFGWSAVCRPLSPSPATGSSSRHDFEQSRLLEEALGLAPGALVITKGQIQAAEAHS